MKYVVIDTCVLVNCTLMNAEGANPDLLKTIFDRIREEHALLLLPAVIELEYARVVPDKLDDVRRHTESFRQQIKSGPLPPPDRSALSRALDEVEKNRATAVDKAKEYFAQIAGSTSRTLRVALDGDIIARATSYALAGLKPYRSVENGLLDADCLIVASIASFAASQGLGDKDTVLICSDNHSDFGVWDKEANAHVIAPDVDDAIPCPVRYYKSPRSLLEIELQVDIEANPCLARTLGEYDNYSKAMLSIQEAYSDFTKSIDQQRIAQELSAAVESLDLQRESSKLAEVVGKIDVQRLAREYIDLVNSLDLRRLAREYPNLLKGISLPHSAVEPPEAPKSQTP